MKLKVLLVLLMLALLGFSLRFVPNTRAENEDCVRGIYIDGFYQLWGSDQVGYPKSSEPVASFTASPGDVLSIPIYWHEMGWSYQTDYMEVLLITGWGPPLAWAVVAQTTVPAGSPYGRSWTASITVPTIPGTYTYMALGHTAHPEYGWTSYPSVSFNFGGGSKVDDIWAQAEDSWQLLMGGMPWYADWASFGDAETFTVTVTTIKEFAELSQTYYDETVWGNVFPAPDGLVNGWGNTIFVLNWPGGWLEIECYNGFWIGDWYSVWMVDQNVGALWRIFDTPEVETDWHHACPYGPHTGAGTVYSYELFNVGWLPPGTYEFRVRNELFQILTGARPVIPPCPGPLDGWSPAGYYIGFHRKHLITFDQSGVGSDFTGTVVTIDSVGYGVSALPVSFWWRENSVHTFSFASPLDTLLGKRYVWTSTTGLSTLQSDTLTITASGSVTGNYKTQYYLTVLIYPDGLTPAPTPPSGWRDACETVPLWASQTATKDTRTYVFAYWSINSKFVYSMAATVHMDAPKTAIAQYFKDPPGDVNLDGKVDMSDISLIAYRYGTRQGDAKYSLLCDLNGDGQINLIDLATAARNLKK